MFYLFVYLFCDLCFCAFKYFVLLYVMIIININYYNYV